MPWALIAVISHAGPFTDRTLRFKQSSLHLANRVSTGMRFMRFHRILPFQTCSFPLCLSAAGSYPRQVSLVTQGYHAQPLLCYTGITLQRNTAHFLKSVGQHRQTVEGTVVVDALCQVDHRAAVPSKP
jgi:hypothetical protein